MIKINEPQQDDIYMSSCQLYMYLYLYMYSFSEANISGTVALDGHSCKQTGWVLA